MGVTANAFKAFKHFVAGDAQAAGVGMTLGEERAPSRMGVQDAAGVAVASDGEVQKCFGGGLAVSAKRTSVGVDFKEVAGCEGGFVQAGGSDQKLQRIAPQNTTVVAAGAEGPAARVKFAADRGELGGDPANVWCRDGRRGRCLGARRVPFHGDEYAMRDDNQEERARLAVPRREQRQSIRTASITQMGDFVATVRVILKPLSANSLANSSALRSRPPGSINISMSIHLARCGSLPGARILSMRMTLAVGRAARWMERRIVPARSSFQSWM